MFFIFKKFRNIIVRRICRAQSIMSGFPRDFLTATEHPCIRVIVRIFGIVYRNHLVVNTSVNMRRNRMIAGFNLGRTKSNV